MLFKLSTILATLAISAAPLVLALPNAAGKALEARSPAPHHGNAPHAHQLRRSHPSLGRVAKRSNHRKRRNCPAPASASVSTSTEAAPTGGNTSPTTTDSPAAPAPTEDPTSSQEAPPAESPAPEPAPSSNSDPAIQAYLTKHNDERRNHGASALTWADDLAQVAQSWANGCVWQHSGGAFGENLSAGTSMDPAGAVQLWLNEAPDYNPSNPQFSHWTQVVWKDTKEVGCAVATCSGEAIFGKTGYGAASFYVCEYRPAGNYAGQFAANVQA